jgi:hypothetical protein
MVLKKPAQLQPFAKSLDEPHATEVGKMAFLEGKTNFSGTFWHHAQNTLLGAFVRRTFWRPNDNFLRSENWRLA